MKFVFPVIFAGLLLVVVFAQQDCSPPPTLPPGSRWVSNPNCTSGPNYDTLTPPRERCHCWGRCGYICSPKESGGESSTTTTRAPTSTTSAAGSTTTAKTSPCPHGPIWYNPKGQRCHCQSFNQQAYYVCEDVTTTTTGTTTASSGSTTASSTTTTSGTTTTSNTTTTA